MLTFTVERFRSCWQDVDRIGRLHWEETEEYRHDESYNPDWKRYFNMDDSGWFFVATARDEGQMIGYVGMYVMPSMHTQQMLATEDFFFLEEPYRKGWNAIRFLKFVEKECRLRGAVKVEFTDKKGKGRILEFLGYKVVPSQQFSKTVGADSTFLQPRSRESASNVRSVSSTTA